MADLPQAGAAAYVRPVRVALVDTGVAAGLPLLRDRLIATLDCDPRAAAPPRLLAAQAGRDRNVHGTGLAAIMVGLAPRVELVNVAVLDHRVSCTCEALVAALRHLAAAPLQLDVVNLSLEVARPSRDLLAVLTAFVERGVTVIQARRAPQPLAPGVIPVVAGPWREAARVELRGPGLAARGARTASLAPGGGQTHQQGASLAAATITGLTAAYLAGRRPPRRAFDAARLYAALGGSGTPA